MSNTRRPAARPCNVCGNPVDDTDGRGTKTAITCSNCWRVWTVSCPICDETFDVTGIEDDMHEGIEKHLSDKHPDSLIRRIRNRLHRADT